MNEKFEIPVIYQDEHLIVVNKPIDLPVHKNDHMALDAPYLTKLIGNLTGRWIYNVHRLDSKTSGVIVLAFSSEIARHLTQQFEKKEVEKSYIAIVRDNPGTEGTFTDQIVVRKKSKKKTKAITHFRTLKTIETEITYKEFENICLSMVEVHPETGKWHQIRQHFARNRFDILGDNHHGDFTLNRIITDKTGIKRLFLHASKLTFIHPVTNERVFFEAPLPEEYTTTMDCFEKHYLD